ncbi:DUF805 domain-containing protein [Xanthovirga aplysinae]|uniref:DUF805 domain-containing protein n=1 Tax=Xanthovirga aplysinae TaxID=2529853 RepID=UPI0012BBF610|nr:DUF805 domain-containing protein [Xanthovirga aplysinae]MTI29766.1 DUF805 domain-containing protein [Xanthovirga aplysinae]
MKNYFYFNGKEKQGPFSFEELKDEEVKKDSLIWFEGLEDWIPASDLEEMKPILELKPPSISTIHNEPEALNRVEETQTKKATDSQANLTGKTKKRMFSKPFSFEGRIRRTEYGISFIVYMIIITFVNAIVESGEFPIIGLTYIPLLWFMWAQGAKRCHDIGKSGWFQIIPFYIFWMLFTTSAKGINDYGLNPKG